MADNEAWLVLKADIEDIQRKLNQIQTTGATSASSMTTNWVASATKIASALSITFSVKKIIDFTKQSVDAFAVTEYSAMSLDNVLKNMGVSQEGIDSVESLVSNLEKTKYFDDSVIRAALSNAIIKLGDVDMAIKTVNVAMEIARARNIDLSDAVQRLSLGLLGNSRGLKDLGIDIKDFGEDAKLTAEQKLAILNTVLGKVKGATEDFASTTKGKMEEAKTSWNNFKEAVGGFLAPFTKMTSELVSEGLNKMTTAINNVNKAQEQWNDNMKIGIDLYTGLPIEIPKDVNYATNNFDKQLKSVSYSVRNIKDDIKNTGDNIKDTGDAIEKAFEPLWRPITLMGGRIGELAKFVGNLGMVAPKAKIKHEITVNVNVNDTSAGSKVAKEIIKSVKTMSAKEIMLGNLSYESHATGGG